LEISARGCRVQFSGCEQLRPWGDICSSLKNRVHLGGASAAPSSTWGRPSQDRDLPLHFNLPGKVLNEQGRLFCQPKVEANRDEEECWAFLRGIDRAAVKDHESRTRHLFHWGLSWHLLSSGDIFTHYQNNHTVACCAIILLYIVWGVDVWWCTASYIAIKSSWRCLLTNACFGLKSIKHWKSPFSFWFKWGYWGSWWLKQKDQWGFSWFGALKNESGLMVKGLMERNPQLMNCFVIKVAVILKVSIAYADIVITNQIFWQTVLLPIKFF